MTPEPQGEIHETLSKRLFVVQEHHARRLHWDLRLEMDGVLKSWAVPKGPPLNVGIKRLAIQVEDHPMEYANFEGSIPEGEYGAGMVKIWDRGTYHLSKFSNDKIMIVFFGKKLKGSYIMIKTEFAENSWILFKMKEKA